MKRLWPRLALILTAFLCLGTAGYAGRAWWAKENARDCYRSNRSIAHPIPMDLVVSWKLAPWVGDMGDPGALSFAGGDFGPSFPTHACGLWSIRHPFRKYWFPRRTYYELLKIVTGLDLGNNPATWEAWFKTHPNLVWDVKRKRLVTP